MPVEVLIVIGVAVLLVLAVIVMYNGLVSARNSVDEGWSGIDVQLKRRHDLIPNLVETVRGYATHESTVFENVVAARSAAQQAQSPQEVQQTENMLTGTLRQLFALGEAYPDLKASANFVDLQAQLSDTEDKIQAARRIYNGNARDYNTKVQSVPTNLIANTFKFQGREYFEIEDPSERQTPAVKFS